LWAYGWSTLQPDSAIMVFGLKGLHMTAQAFSLGSSCHLTPGPERGTHI